jgi:two-component system, cell cycle response regulator
VKRSRFSRWLVTKKIFDIPTISKVILKCPQQEDRTKIGELAITEKLLTEQQVTEILDLQKESGKRFGDTAIQLSFLSQQQISYLLAVQIEPPIVLGKALIALELLESTETAELIKQYLLEMKQVSNLTEEQHSGFSYS